MMRRLDARGHKATVSREGSPRVVICNVYPDDNRGGAAITSATIAVVSRAIPDAAITLITTESRAGGISETHRHTLRAHPDVELLPMAMALGRHRMASISAIARSILRLALGRTGRGRGLQRVREARMVIGKGGQLFGPRSGFGGLAGLWLAVFPLIFAHRLGIPTALYGVTIGPYARGHSRVTRWVVAWVLRRIDLIIVRDGESMRQVREFNIPSGSVYELGDAVFGLEPPPRSAAQPLLDRYDLVGRSFAALTVTAPARGELAHLVPTLDEVLRTFLDDGTIDRVAVAVQTDGPTTSDLADSRRFVETFNDPRVLLITDDLAPADLIVLYGEATFLLGCRLHSAIFGLLGGTLSFPVSRQYMRKADDIFGFVGLDRLVLSVERSTADWVATIRRELADAATARRDIHSAVKRFRSDADVATRLLADLVGTSGGTGSRSVAG